MWKATQIRQIVDILRARQAPSLRRAIGHRIRDVGKRRVWKIALIAVKEWAERTGKARYWTEAELQGMLKTSHFNVLSVNLECVKHSETTRTGI